MRERALVFSKSVFASSSIGKAFYIQFQGYNANLGQFSIIPDDKEPLKGKEIKYGAKTVREYGKNLEFSPIPFEMLKTYETKPQVIVNVNGLPAVCHNVTCDFTYMETVGEVSSFTFDEPSKKVVITGTNLPTKAEDIQVIWFAMSKCTLDATKMPGTSLECTLV